MAESERQAGVTFCNWCPVPERPSPVHHPHGHPRHLVRLSWADVAAGLQRAGWTVEYRPLSDLPPYVWRSPGGLSGSDYRSHDAESPPEAVMRNALANGLVSFAELIQPLTPAQEFLREFGEEG